jgi:hypothetical protein
MSTLTVVETLMLQTAVTMASMTQSDTMITTATTTHTVRVVPSAAPFSYSHLCDFQAQPDTDSDVDIYGQRYPPASSESLGPSRIGMSDSNATAWAEYAGPPGAREAYPAWSAERQIPLSKEEIEDIFLDLTQKFGFQRDSMRNMVTFIFIQHYCAF